MTGVEIALLGGAGLQALGGLVGGGQQNKLNKEQLRIQWRRLGLDERQIEHLIAQAERQNAIQSANVGRMNPMLDAMIQRGQEGASARPDAIRLAPPKFGANPHSMAASAPPAITGLPGLTYDSAPQAQARMPDPASAPVTQPQMPPMQPPNPLSQGTIPQIPQRDPRELARMLAMRSY